MGSLDFQSRVFLEALRMTSFIRTVLAGVTWLYGRFLALSSLACLLVLGFLPLQLMCDCTTPRNVLYLRRMSSVAILLVPSKSVSQLYAFCNLVCEHTFCFVVDVSDAHIVFAPSR